MVDSNDDSLQKALSVKLSEVKNQGNQVRSLIREVRHRQDEARFRYSALKLEKASIKKDLQATGSGGNGGGSGNKEALHQAMVNTQERRLFYILSFKIYGGVAGLYDYGPPGCAVKANVLGFWREHFVLEENMLEVDCTCVTPEVVLKASDHVEKFTDLMVKDEATGNCYRADHLLKDFCKDKLEKDLIITSEMAQELKEVLSQLDVLSAEELGACIKKYGITAPDIKNSLSDPYHNNSVSMGKRRGKGSKKRRLGKYQCGRSKKISESSMPKTAAILTDDKSACNVAEATSSSHADMNTRERVRLIERGR